MKKQQPQGAKERKHETTLSKCQTKKIGIRYGLGTDLVRRWYGANLKKIEIQKERKKGCFSLQT